MFEVIGGVAVGVITGLAILAFLRERRARLYSEWASGEYEGELRLRLLVAAENLSVERGRGQRIAEASRENYFEKLRLGSLIETLTGELNDADELIEELEDIARDALDGWTRADSIAERAVTVAERATRIG